MRYLKKDGTLVDTGGLLPSKDGARIRIAHGAITVTDGPFVEFMDLHRKHGPEFEGESEVRPMFEPGMGP